MAGAYDYEPHEFSRISLHRKIQNCSHLARIAADHFQRPTKNTGDRNTVRGFDLNWFEPRIQHRITCSHLVENAPRLGARNSEITCKRARTHAVNTTKHACLVDLALLFSRLDYAQRRYCELAIGIARLVVCYQRRIACECSNADLFVA